jgi:hypothetical protein
VLTFKLLLLKLSNDVIMYMHNGEVSNAASLLSRYLGGRMDNDILDLEEVDNNFALPLSGGSQ